MSQTTNGPTDRPKTAAEVLAMLQPVGQPTARAPEKPRQRGAEKAGSRAKHLGGTITAPPRHNGHAGKPAASVGADSEDADEQGVRDEIGAKLERALTYDDALRMVASTARRALQVIENPNAKDSDKKHAAVSMGVAIDKWLALTSRPARPEAPAVAETMRPEILELGLRLVEATRERPTSPTATTNGTPTLRRP